MWWEGLWLCCYPSFVDSIQMVGEPRNLVLKRKMIFSFSFALFFSSLFLLCNWMRMCVCRVGFVHFCRLLATNTKQEQREVRERECVRERAHAHYARWERKWRHVIITCAAWLLHTEFEKLKKFCCSILFPPFSPFFFLLLPLGHDIIDISFQCFDHNTIASIIFLSVWLII